jgi:outer membrane protein assembly factor BamA
MNFTRLFNNNNYNHTLDASYFRLFVEEAGILGEPIFGRLIEGTTLTFFQYGRILADYRRYFKLSATNFLVSRINFGAARSFNQHGVLPYDRYFYAGGGTSIRAFRPRRLGPGSYFAQAIDSTGKKLFDEAGNPIRNENIEQQGELLIESNLEYRFNIWSIMNGALFVDAGNIWMISEDEARPGSQFQFKNFFQELAVGAGFGLRFDFTFLIARLDVATRIHDPTLVKNRFVIGNNSFSEIVRGNTLVNLGIGYPF